MLKVTLIVCGDKMPSWVNDAFYDYQKRLTDFVQFRFIEIPLLKRPKDQNITRILEKEMDNIRAVIPEQSRIIALDVEGTQFSSEELALRFEKLSEHHSHLSFIIGGPEGLTDAFKKTVQERWSLSRLTLPHPIARVVFIEAIYRAFTISHHHPYHK